MSNRGRIFTPDPIAKHPLNDGLVSWWLGLPELSGSSNLFDLRQRNKGALANGPTWVSDLNGFGALSFDGTNQKVTIPLVNTASFTIASWFRGPLSSGRDLWGYPYPNYAPAVCISSSTNISAVWGGSFAISGVGSLTANRWHHVAVTTAPGATTGTDIRLYQDGVLIGSANDFIPGGTANGATLQLAQGVEFTGAYWNGQIADLVAAGRTWSASDVWGWYDQSRRGYPDTLRRVGSKTYFLAVSPPPPPPPAGYFGLAEEGMIFRSIRRW